MKANELRVNNWYMSVKWGIPVKCNLIDLYELCHASDGAVDHPPIDNMFEPISLTEEWLLKFGFKMIDVWMSINFNPRMGIRFYNGNAAECDITQDDKFIAFRNCHILYVHQLQNLYFALTGEELTIKENDTAKANK